MTWYTDMYSIMAIGLLYKFDSVVKNVCYMGFGSNGVHDRCSHCLMVGHYWTHITSNMGHLRSESVKLLVLWTVVYNGWGIGIVLYVLRDSTNLAEK
jgi:hypothetical protein